MPQLDRIIIFTQLFWLFIIFVTIYTVLTTLFLPILIKVFKTRNLFVQFISEESNKLQLSFFIHQQITIQTLNKSFSVLKHFLHPNLALFYKETDTTTLLDTHLLVYILNMVLYCNRSLSTVILFNSKNYNFIFNNK
nr:ATP synthase F0 subunit 8 [Thorea hispida]ARX95979.1 ATP synthase F0 subunit 8 [Thorea hispida]